MPMRSKSLKERFWPKVAIAGEDECWLWQATRDSSGYGKVSVEGRDTGAHRAAYMLSRGRIPDGLMVLHRCDTPLCCNPAHLFLGTSRDNVNDMHAKRRERKAHGETHYSAKLTLGAVAEIRERFALGGTTYAVLGRTYGVSPQNVRFIVLGKTWKQDPR